jgi:hypothetical protein
MPSGKTTLTLHVDEISCIGANQYNDSGGTNQNLVLGIFPESVSQKKSLESLLKPLEADLLETKKMNMNGLENHPESRRGFSGY